MKQTGAVDWLLEQLKKYEAGTLLLKLHKEEIAKAKEIETHNVETAYKQGRYAAMDDNNDIECGREPSSLSATDYYKEIFK